MTFIGKELRLLGAFVHTLFSRKVTTNDVIVAAEDIAACANFYGTVKKDCEGITDPAALAKAVCDSAVNNEGLLPTSLQGNAFVQEAESICVEISGLPLATIEADLKAALAAVK